MANLRSGKRKNGEGGDFNLWTNKLLFFNDFQSLGTAKINLIIINENIEQTDGQKLLSSKNIFLKITAVENWNIQLSSLIVIAFVREYFYHYNGMTL